METICWRFYIKTPFIFWDMCLWDMYKVCLKAFRNNRICQKLPYFLRSLQISRANNSRILRIHNAKFSGYCFYMNTNKERYFQICISVPLNMCNFWVFSNTCSIVLSISLLPVYPSYLDNTFSGLGIIFWVYLPLTLHEEPNFAVLNTCHDMQFSGNNCFTWIKTGVCVSMWVWSHAIHWQAWI